MGPRNSDGLNHLCIANEAHRRRVLTGYVAFDNHAQPHQGFEQRCLVTPVAPPGEGKCAAAISSVARSANTSPRVAAARDDGWHQRT